MGFSSCRTAYSIFTKVSLDKFPGSVFIVSVFLEIKLNVALLEFYFTEVRTKQPTFAADLWKAVIIRPSGGKKAFLVLEQWLKALFEE